MKDTGLRLEAMPTRPRRTAQATAWTAPAHGGGDGLDGLVLADDVLLEPVLQLGQALVLGLLDGAGGDLGPQLDDPGQVLRRQGGRALGVQAAQLLLELDLPALDARQALVLVIPLLARGEDVLPVLGEGAQLPL